MSTTIRSCNYGVTAAGAVVIQSFNGPDDLLTLDLVDQVDNTQFDGSWTSPYWPTLKSKYDLVMPGELPAGGPTAPSSGGGGSQNIPAPGPGS
jgi:hypothetical protein